MPMSIATARTVEGVQYVAARVTVDEVLLIVPVIHKRRRRRRGPVGQTRSVDRLQMPQSVVTAGTKENVLNAAILVLVGIVQLIVA